MPMPMLTLGSMGIMFLPWFLGTLLSLVGAIAVPVALGHFVAQGELRAAFRVRHWWRIVKADKLGYFVTRVVVVGLLGMAYVGFMLTYSTLVRCCFIPILMSPFGLVILPVVAAPWLAPSIVGPRPAITAVSSTRPTESRLCSGSMPTRVDSRFLPESGLFVY